MNIDNLFFGENYHSSFALLIDKRIRNREWFTYSDIMAEYLGPKNVNGLDRGVSNCKGYRELLKTFLEIKKIIKKRFGTGCFEESGTNRDKHFLYVGTEDDPIADLRNVKVVNDLKKYWKFCQDSAGFFPQSWLDYYFQDCKDLLEIKDKKKRGEQVISASIDRIHKNIELLPFLYESVVNKKVLEIDYKPYDEEQETLLFHPHYLKEYNGRWHLFGHAKGREPENGYDLALDRIQKRPREKDKIEYIMAPPMYYKHCFEDMVGVSHLPDPIIDDIIVRAHSSYIYNLVVTKPLHSKQNVKMEFGEHKDGTYGDFIVHIEVNNEFIGRILQMGAGLEIIAPKEARDLFSKRVQELANLYIEKDKK